VIRVDNPAYFRQPSGCIGWWYYGGTAVAKLGNWTDRTGLGHTVLLKEHAQVTTGGLVLDGTGDYGLIAADAHFNPSGTDVLSFAAWVQMTDNTQDDYCMGQWAGSAEQYGFSALSAAVWKNSSAADESQLSTTKPTNGAWAHVAMVLDAYGDAANVYLNGNLNNGTRTNPTGSGWRTVTNRQVFVGQLNGSYGYLQGAMDDIQLYRGAALTQNQILHIMRNSPGSRIKG
jgi:hypothetical protein